MPALPPVTGVIKCSVGMPVTVHPNLQTRFYIKYTGTAPTVAQLQTFANSIVTAFGTNLAALTSVNITGVQVTCQDLSSSTGAVAISSTTSAGTRAGTEAPVQSAMGIRYNIARRYRGGKPKGFWPFGVQADQADVAHWSVAFANTCATNIGAFFTAILAAGWTGAGTLTQVNVSYFAGFTTVIRTPFRARNVPNLRQGGPITDLVTSYTSVTTMYSQRRRRLAA